MKKSSFCVRLLALLLLVGFTACEKDDTTDFSTYINNPESSDDPGIPSDPAEPPVVVPGSDTLYIAYNGTMATVSGDAHNYVTISGADVTVNALEADTTMLIVLSGSTDDGSLLVYRQKPYTLRLNGVSITNPDGPAINNQCSKWLYVDVADGTENTLADGETYAEQTFDQKGTLFSEGQICLQGSGKLTVNGYGKSGIVSDDYIVIDDGTLNVSVRADGGRGVKANDGVTINGGNISITTSGDCKIESKDGVRDTTSAAGIKSDSIFVMTGGRLTIKSSGDGGKGITCNANVEFCGGTLNITTTGSNDVGKPKGVKSDTGIIVSGGSFTVNVDKSWACDNGKETEDPEQRLTVMGEPTTKTLKKKAVVVKY